MPSTGDGGTRCLGGSDDSLTHKAGRVLHCISDKYLSLVFRVCCYSTATNYDGDGADGTELIELLRANGHNDGGPTNIATHCDDDDALHELQTRSQQQRATFTTEALEFSEMNGNGDGSSAGQNASTFPSPDPFGVGPDGAARQSAEPGSAGEPQALFVVPYDPQMDLP